MLCLLRPPEALKSSQSVPPAASAIWSATVQSSKGTLLYDLPSDDTSHLGSQFVSHKSQFWRQVALALLDGTT